MDKEERVCKECGHKTTKDWCVWCRWILGKRNNKSTYKRGEEKETK